MRLPREAVVVWGQPAAEQRTLKVCPWPRFANRVSLRDVLEKCRAQPCTDDVETARTRVQVTQFRKQVKKETPHDEIQMSLPVVTSRDWEFQARLNETWSNLVTAGDEIFPVAPYKMPRCPCRWDGNLLTQIASNQKVPTLKCRPVGRVTILRKIWLLRYLCYGKSALNACNPLPVLPTNFTRNKTSRSAVWWLTNHHFY